MNVSARNFIAMNRLTAKELLALAKAEKNARKRIRLLAISHFLNGKNRTQIALILKVSRRSVNDWVANYQSLGLAGLDAKKQKGRDAYLSDEQKKQLCEFIKRHYLSDKKKPLVGIDIQNYIHDNFAINYHHNSIYKLLKDLGFSWVTPHSRHLKQTKQIPDDFKKMWAQQTDQKSADNQKA